MAPVTVKVVDDPVQILLNPVMVGVKQFILARNRSVAPVPLSVVVSKAVEAV